MEPSPPKNPNPNPKSNSYQISGVPVEFPYKPYGTQLAFMGRVISTLDRAKRHGHCHALLESPTGTGKSLSLLCSSLAWQRHHLRRFPQLQPGPTADPLVHGGGFIPEPDSSSVNLEQGGQPGINAKAQRKIATPTIYYASRTHSQISQVIREFRKTSYRVPMAVLASRKRYCTNKHVCMKENIDEECKILLKDGGAGCLEFKNAHKVKSHSSLQKDGIHEIHDIEDLIKVGRTVKGCSYFASQTLAAEAQIVFCPYSYIINPIVRRAMDIDIKGSIVILDEAHNIEDMARDSGSLDVEEDVLYTLQTELGQLCMDESVAQIYQPLYDMLQGIISWIGDKKDNLQKREFEHYSSYWTGDKAINELQLAGITRQCFPVLQECATKAIKAVQDAESEVVHLSGISAITLESIFSSLGYFFAGNGCHAFDYQLVLQRFVKRDSSNAASGWTCTLSMWCLNPAVVFGDIANLSLSVILTSGTLSPMGSFASELGVQFEACMEAPHVIDVESQLWASVITSGPGNCQLNASYKTADGYAFQDSLGGSLEEICRVVPGGALVFFPSYKLLEKLRLRWCQTGQWSRLNAQKTVFVEPRGNVDEFESVLEGYYNSIRGKGTTIRRISRLGQKRLSKHHNPNHSPENSSNSGAAFLAVCRGKVSEGIDFADENARVVVIVGIPFPNTNDIQVVLKKRYNDTYKPSKSLLSGSDWYCQQAFRALNQAAGRCIRHRFDYGAIILLDERFKEQRNLNYISKWLRNSIKQFDSFDESMNALRNFFAEKILTQKGNENEFATSDTDADCLITSEPNLKEVNVQKINENQKKINSCGRKNIFPKDAPAELKPLLARKGQFLAESAGETNEKPLNNHRENVDSESHPLLSGCHKSKQTDALRNGNMLGTTQHCNQIPDGKSFSCCTTISNGISFEGTTTVSPERVVYLDPSDTEQESLLNKSVNSYNQRKRKQKDQTDNFVNGFSGCKPQKQLHNLLMDGYKDSSHISSDIAAEKKRHICCLVCKNPLGLPENNFLVASSSMSSSKSYLSYVLNYGPRDYKSSDCVSRSQINNIQVMVSEMSAVDQRIFDRHTIDGALQHDIWCEEDGCVFRAVFCPFCGFHNTCLGVQIKATDSSNVHLLNKVVFLADNLYIKEEQMPVKEVMLVTYANNIKQGSALLEFEKYAYNPMLNDSALIKKTKSKLRLPKKEQITSSQNEDGVII